MRIIIESVKNGYIIEYDDLNEKWIATSEEDLIDLIRDGINIQPN